MSRSPSEAAYPIPRWLTVLIYATLAIIVVGITAAWALPWRSMILRITVAPIALLLIAWYLGRPLVAGVAHRQLRQTWNGESWPSVTVQMPAYNEAENIREAVESVIEQRYPGDMELIVVDDGSTDSTWDILRELADEYADLRVFSQANQGISVTRNRALREGEGEIVVTMDSDTVLESGSLKAIVNPFHDGDVVAVASNCEVKNASESLWTRCQSIEYLVSMEMARAFQSKLRHLMVVSGGCGAYRRSVIEDIGGWSEIGHFYAEDFDMTIQANRYGRVVFSPEAVALTVVPKTLREWWEQRMMWAGRGLRTVLKHRGAMFNTDYSVLGLFALPFKALTTGYIMWAVLSAGYYLIDTSPTAAVRTVVFGYAGILTATAGTALFLLAIVSVYALHTRPLRLSAALPVYLCIYRQLHIAVRFVAFSYVLSLYAIGRVRAWTAGVTP